MGRYLPHGDGTIWEDRPGHWRGQIRLPGGRRHNVAGTSWQDCRRQLDKVRRQVEAGQPVPSERLTLGEYLAGPAYRRGWTIADRDRLEGWLGIVARIAVRPRVFIRYEQLPRLHVMPALGRARLARITPEDVQRLYARLAGRDLSPRTVHHVHAVLSNALGDAARSGLVARNVAELATPPRVPEPRRRELTAEQARALLAAVRDTPLDCICTLALSTGLRLGELLGLRWGDVDLEARVLRVRRQVQRVDRHGMQELEPKSRTSRRSVRLVPVAVGALRRQQTMLAEMRMLAGDRWEEHELVHPNAFGRPLEAGRVWQRFNALRIQLGLPDLRFHDLRHSAATLLFSLGTHPKVVQEILGHSQSSITVDLYTHHVPELHAEAMDGLGRLLEPGPEGNPPRTTGRIDTD